MKYSIRVKLFITLGLLTLFFVLLSIILNNLFLEKFYLISKKIVLEDSYKKIDSLYNGDSEELSLELERFEDSIGVNILILDDSFNTIYSSRQNETNFRSRIFNRNNIHSITVSLIKERVSRILENGQLVEIRYDRRLRSNFVDFYALLSNKDYIFISAPVAAIKESVETSNKFFLFTGIITMLVGGILIFFITTKFTKPILDLNYIAQRMSLLDFSKRYPVKTQDEVGHLGDSINSLSEQLHKSILELKSANEKLKKDIEREQKIDEIRKEFITNVSHELKTPIALIQGYSEGLKVNVNEDEENKNYYCDVIMDEALKMDRLVRQLLDLSQIESGEISLERSDFDISEMADAVIKKNSIILKEKNIDITVEKDENTVVNADYEKIEQVLLNYLSNAVNHTDENKQIKVSIRRIEKKVKVSVFNTGRHIPEASMDKIWSSFYKVDKARTRVYGGAGLGLSIVRAIMNAHGGGYGAVNVEGSGNLHGGVEFWFELESTASAPEN